MGEFIETDAGAAYRGGDVTDEAARADAEEREQQEAALREASSRIGAGTRAPAETTLESATPHVIVSDPLQARDEIEKMLADKTHPLWDPSHPQHETAQQRYLEFVMLERGANPLDPEENPVVGIAREGGRIQALETELAGTYEEAPDRGVVADRPEQDAALSLGRNLEGGEAVVRGFLAEAVHFQGRPAPDAITLHQQITAKWPMLAERHAIDDRLEDLHAALDHLLAEEGVKPAQRERWLSELGRIEDQGVPGIEYLLGRFQQSLWDRVPAFADHYAAVQSAAYEATEHAKARAQQSAPDDPDRIVGHFGR